LQRLKLLSNLKGLCAIMITKSIAM